MVAGCTGGARRPLRQADSAGFTALFTPDCYFYDVSAGQKYYGADIGQVVDIYARAFPDMHRALDKVYDAGDTIVVELSLNGMNILV